MSTAYSPRAERIFCGVCMQPIEGCEGRYTDWMHSHSRLERCEGSTAFAYPETLRQQLHRGNMKRHSTTASSTSMRALSSVA